MGDGGEVLLADGPKKKLLTGTDKPTGSKKTDGTAAETPMDKQVDTAEYYLKKGKTDAAARYLLDTYYRVVFKDDNIKKKARLIDVTVRVLDALFAAGEEIKGFELLSNLYQAELAGKIKLTPADEKRLIVFQFKLQSLNEGLLMPISYALDGLSYDFVFDYYTRHGKKTSVESVIVQGNATMFPLEDELESAFFIAALAMAESGGDAVAINSKTGCLGKMQLEEGTAKAMAKFIGWEEGKYSLTDAQENMVLGGVYLRYLNKRLYLKLQGTAASKDKTDLSALSIIAYSASNGDENDKVKSFIATIKAGGKIDWFGQAFKQKYPTWWRHIVRVMGTLKAYKNHIY